MNSVKPKKHLGQHFLTDLNIAQKIAESLTINGEYSKVLEIGPGMGVLTQYLMKNDRYTLFAVDIDKESIEYLKKNFPALSDRIIDGDFLRMDLSKLFPEKFGIIGNFPYNISSQIFFKVLDYRQQIPEVVGMIQKEVAERIASKHGNKTYGILSVLLQAFYNIEYLFTVHENVFKPAPKVKSAVIRLKRNDRKELPCDEKSFIRVVKQGFQNRRKTLRNALKSLNLPAEIQSETVFNLRAEQLSVDDFIQLTLLIQPHLPGGKKD